MNDQDKEYLRDLFAGFIVNALIVNEGCLDDRMPNRAYLMADLMLEAREPEQTVGLPPIKRRPKAK